MKKIDKIYVCALSIYKKEMNKHLQNVKTHTVKCMKNSFWLKIILVATEML